MRIAALARAPIYLRSKPTATAATQCPIPAKYRTREEVQKIREEKDAIEHVRDLLLTSKHCSEEDLKAIDKDIKAVVNESAEFAKQSPEPALDELWTDIYAQAEA